MQSSSSTNRMLITSSPSSPSRLMETYSVRYCFPLDTVVLKFGIRTSTGPPFTVAETLSPDPEGVSVIRSEIIFRPSAPSVTSRPTLNSVTRDELELSL